jgi:hypothetical protein
LPVVADKPVTATPLLSTVPPPPPDVTVTDFVVLLLSPPLSVTVNTTL